MKSTLKETYAKHLWVFLLSNLIVFVVGSVLNMQSTFASVLTLTTALRAGLAGGATLVPLIINGLMSGDAKARLVFWRLDYPLPGAEAFSRYLYMRMRQTHKAGEKMFVDYAGQTMPVVRESTGEVRQAQIFVAALGASNYTYVEAAWTQSLPEWIMAHTRAFAYFQGCPALVVCDNLRSAVSKACLYEPDLNPTYHAMARHYGVAVMPARSGKPRDKAKVENGVLNVERQILAPLRHRRDRRAAQLSHRRSDRLG